MVLAAHLGGLVARVVEHLAVHVAEDVVPHPAHHLEIAGREHRRQDALQERLAGLAVAAGVGQAAREGELAQGRRRRAGGGGEVDVRRARLEGRHGIEAARRQRASSGIPEERGDLAPPLGDWSVGGGLGGGDVDDDDVSEVVVGREGFDVGADPVDRLPWGLNDIRDRGIGELADLVPGGDDGARAEPLLDGGEGVGGGIEHLRGDRPALDPHPPRLVGEMAGADVVAADDDLVEADQIERRAG